MTNDATTRPPRAPLAALERQFLATYVAGAGHDLQQLLARDDEVARQAGRLGEQVHPVTPTVPRVPPRSPE